MNRDLGGNPGSMASPQAPAGLGPSGYDPGRIAKLREDAWPLLECEHYVNAPHEEGRIIGFIVPDSEDVLLTKGTAAARAVLKLARIAVESGQ